MRRLKLEFARGNIMTKANPTDVSIRLKHSTSPEYTQGGECYIESFYDILFRGHKVGSLSTRESYEPVMDPSYDPDDFDCYENPGKYFDDLYDYINHGELLHCHLDRFDIDDSWQNIGIGTAILNKYFRGATVAPDNPDAQRLYDRLGTEDYSSDCASLDCGYGVYRLG